MLKALMSLARTPMDEKGGRSLADYEKKLTTSILSLTPWQKRSGPLSHFRKRIKSGSVVVIPDASDRPNDPLYQDAAILKG